MRQFKGLSFVILVLLLTIPSVIPLLKPGFFVTDDGTWMIIRFVAFYRALADFQIPVRLLPGLNFGYSYPVSNFLYPGFMYMAAPIHLVGISFVNSIKIILAVSLIGSCLGMYFYLRQIVDRVSSVIGSLAFLYAPYHLYDVYKRGSVGEVLALLFIPCIFWFVEVGNPALIAIFVFLLIVSHNTLALLFLPLVVVYIILRKNYVWKSLGGVFFGVVMSSFFSIPAVFELKYTKFASTAISNPLNYFAAINLLGIISFASVLLVIVLSLIIYKKSVRFIPYFRLGVFFLVLSILSLFLSSEISAFIWKIIPSSFIQFPFRFLSITIFTCSFLVAYTLFILKDTLKYVLIVIFITIIVFFSYNYLIVKNTNNYPDSYYATNPATTTVKNEYMPKWVKEEPITIYKSKVEYVKGEGSITNLSQRSNKITFTATGDPNAIVRINTIYYPGWVAFSNNDVIKISHNNKLGVMDIKLDRRVESVTLVFRETILRIIADSITIICFVLLFLFIIRRAIKFS